MRLYSYLFRLYAGLPVTNLDPQVIRECQCGKYIPVEVVLSQFKGALQDTQEYKVLRDYLVSIYDDQTVRELEGMNEPHK